LIEYSLKFLLGDAYLPCRVALPFRLGAKMDRKEMIRIAATELFAERGFQATSTAEVAKRAGVSEGVIFYHFSTKEGILISLFEKIIEDFIAGVDQVLAEAPNGLEAVLGCLRLNQAMNDQRSQEVLVLVRDMPASFTEPDSPYRHRMEAGTDRLLELFSRAITFGQRDGTIRPCDQGKTAYLLLGVIIGMGRLTLLGVPPFPDLNEDYMEFCRHALAA